MKKLLLISAIAFSALTNAQLNNRRLVVPEFSNKTVKTYVPASGNTMVVDASFTIPANKLGNGNPNALVMNGADLYVAVTTGTKGIYKFPNYGQTPTTAIANSSLLITINTDVVGITFDASGNLYAAEGSYGSNAIIKYSGANLATRTDLGSGGIGSFLANIAFDSSGNLWASDYINNRVVVIPSASLSTANAPMKQLVNATSPLNATGANLGNTNSALSAGIVNYAFTSPEGVAFDSTGALWVANNNDAGSNGNLLNTNYAQLTKITAGLQATILAGTTTTITTAMLTSANGIKIYNVPSSANGRSQLGGMQIDKVTDRIYVNEQISGSGMYFDIAQLSIVNTIFAAYQLSMVSTNPGNGGIYLASSTQVLGINDIEQANNNVALYPNPSNGEFKIDSVLNIKNITAFDVLGKQMETNVTNGNYNIKNAQNGIYYIKITDENNVSSTKKLVIN